jgi:putative oxidoreductase
MVGRLLVRATVGAIFVGHGTQKLFGWFGGGGPEGTGQFFESVGLRPGRRNALAAGVAETGGGILFAAGLATPLAAAALSSVMLTALRTVFWQDGIRLGKGGYETLLLASAIAEEGPGRLSLDAALGQERRGILWAAAALAGAGVGSTLAIEAGRRYAAASPAEDQELARSAAATVEPSRS